MAMQLHLLRLSLAERAQLSLFRPAEHDGEQYSRERWIRKVFSQAIEFTHRGCAFFYVPEDASDIITGRIGREINVKENHPPEQKLKEMERPAWVASKCFIDPTHSEDGQKVAVEHKRSVGLPISLFESLVSQINASNPDGPYLVEVNSIYDASSFWEFVEKHHGNITNVKFEFVAPNQFGASDDFDKEMRDMRDTEKAKKAKFELENPDGLELKTERIRGAVAYASRGGGSVRAKTKRPNPSRFNSRSNTKHVDIPEGSDVGGDKLSLIKTVSSFIFKR